MKRLICLLLLLAASCSRSALPPDVTEQQPKRETPVDEATYTKIFLAGTIDMGNSVDWQAETIRRFRERNDGRYLFFNPRRAAGLDGTTGDMHYQIRWELEHLEKAMTGETTAAVPVPKTSSSLPSRAACMMSAMASLPSTTS